MHSKGLAVKVRSREHPSLPLCFFPLVHPPAPSPAVLITVWMCVCVYVCLFFISTHLSACVCLKGCFMRKFVYSSFYAARHHECVFTYGWMMFFSPACVWVAFRCTYACVCVFWMVWAHQPWSSYSTPQGVPVNARMLARTRTPLHLNCWKLLTLLCRSATHRHAWGLTRALRGKKVEVRQRKTEKKLLKPVIGLWVCLIIKKSVSWGEMGNFVSLIWFSKLILDLENSLRLIWQLFLSFQSCQIMILLSFRCLRYFFFWAL